MKNRLEELRKQRNIEQEELAEALEVSRQTLDLWRMGDIIRRLYLPLKSRVILI